ncbi:MAG: class I SAM-dependent methyltransferase [Deltaproteobacteria bacterium]|nr:MAG: class I SAM-dependent methyltransferase [Deltaproteobacteria bacterium]
MRCAICSGRNEEFARARLGIGVEAVYLQCSGCGFVQVRNPEWLASTYADNAIAATDAGLVSRALYIRDVASAVIGGLFNGNGPFLDYGAGNGLLVRLMRDAGWDFYWFDRYSRNLFSAGLEADLSGETTYELATAVEVAEHFVDPLAEFRQILSVARNLLFTTQLLPQPTPRPGDWWYYGLDHGQHVAFYSTESLRAIARSMGCHFVSNGRDIHLLSRRKVPAWLFAILCHPATARLLKLTFRRKSLLDEDYRRLTGNGAG